MTTRNRSSAIIVSASLLGAVLALSACQKQDAPPPTAAGAPTAPTAAATPPYTPPTAEQLSQMVAPIALFPDKLVAQVLAGATYPDQVVAANQWLGQNSALKGDILQAAEDKQPWDVSVKSLTMFPAVLSQMAANPDWTRALGDAFVNDPNDVMNAIQALRLKAQQAGHLKSSPQLRVSTTERSTSTVRYETPQPVYAGAPVIAPPPQTIVIESSQPDTVYVPRYDPAVVYGAPVPVYPGYVYRPPSHVADEVVVGALSFGVGVFVGEAISHHSDWGWHDWGMHWGGPVQQDQPAVVYKNTSYVSHSTTVINRVTNNVIVNNNNRTVNNISNVNNINNVNNTRNVVNENRADRRVTVNNVDQRREAVQAAPAAMSMPHFTASDTRMGAAPHAPAPQQMAALHEHVAPAAPEHAGAQHDARAMAEEKKMAEERKMPPMQQMQQMQKEAAKPAMTRMENKEAPAAHMTPPVAHAQPAPQREEKMSMPAHAASMQQHETQARAPVPHPPAQHAADAHEVEKHEAQQHQAEKQVEQKHAADKHEAEKHEGEKLETQHHNG